MPLHGKKEQRIGVTWESRMHWIYFLLFTKVICTFHETINRKVSSNLNKVLVIDVTFSRETYTGQTMPDCTTHGDRYTLFAAFCFVNNCH